MLDIADWPADRPDLAGLTDWVRSTLHASVVEGPVEVLRVKRWGATGLFDVDGERVVVKHASPVVYPHAAAVHRVVQAVCPHATAELLASADGPGWQRSVFARVVGPTVEEAGPQALIAQARTLAEVQTALADADLGGLPGYDLTDVAQTLLDDVTSEGDVAADLVAELRDGLPELQRAAKELAEVPPSLDHPDVQGTNALVRADGSLVLLDWEEAVVGCPLLSLERLLAEAEDLGNVPEVRAAYLDALPWATERLADLALLLAPLKLASEAREYARVLGLPTPHTKLTAHSITKTLARLP